MHTFLMKKEKNYNKIKHWRKTCNKIQILNVNDNYINNNSHKKMCQWRY